MMIFIVSLMVLNLLALPLMGWCVVAVNRRQRDKDLRYHRDILFHHILNELTLQDGRLLGRFQALK